MHTYYLINTNCFNKKAHTHQITRTVEAIQQAGGKITILAPDFQDKGTLEELFEYQNISNPITITFLPTLIRNKTRLRFIFFNVSVSLFLLKQKKKDMVLYLRSEYFYPTVLLMKLFFRSSFYYEIHREGKHVVEKILKKLNAKLANGLVVISSDLKQFFLKYNNKILLAHDAVDLTRFSNREDKATARDILEIPKDKEVVMYIGSVSSVKGVEMIVEQAKQLPNVLHYIVGPVAKEFNKIAAQNIVYTDKVNQEYVPLYQVAADVLVLPHPESIFSQSPMKLFEYMASKRPIVASDLPNIKEVLENKAYYFKPGDNEDYLKFIKQALASKERQIDYQVERYTWENRGSAILDFITVNRK